MYGYGGTDSGALSRLIVEVQGPFSRPSHQRLIAPCSNAVLTISDLNEETIIAEAPNFTHPLAALQKELPTYVYAVLYLSLNRLTICALRRAFPRGTLRYVSIVALAGTCAEEAEGQTYKSTGSFLLLPLRALEN